MISGDWRDNNRSKGRSSTLIVMENFDRIISAIPPSSQILSCLSPWNMSKTSVEKSLNEVSALQFMTTLKYVDVDTNIATVSTVTKADLE